MNVDHDHVTLKVRGLLCGCCNLRLNVLENEAFVTKAREYLTRCNNGPTEGTMEEA